MRTSLLAAALLSLAAPPALADDAPTVTLAVGQTRHFDGYGGQCDDLSVATITVNGVTITALKPGKTICGWTSHALQGARTWVHVVVVEKPDGKPDDRPAR